MGLIKEIDYGTPIRVAEQTVTLTIDGMEVTVPAGTSVMAAAMHARHADPEALRHRLARAVRLLPPVPRGDRGAARHARPPARRRPRTAWWCTRRTTGSHKLRKGVMELYISDHPLTCLTCAANGDCELQDMAGVVGLRDVRYGYDGDNHVAPSAEKYLPKDESNPYFTYDPSKCIVCNRCVRACEEVQGTFALTIAGRGFDSRVAAGPTNFFESECVSCGACVQACPTATLQEKSIHEFGQPEHAEVTTCAYCGVGCSFKAEMQGERVVRMVPYKAGKANEGHSCVKGRFAYGYATHKDRITKPMIREKITDPWREVSWEEAIDRAASEFKRIQAQYGKDSVGGITSSRCTNEEAYLVQKLVRAAFGNNNVDTCARVCHSPTGYGLMSTLGTSAGTQDFKSVEQSDVILVIGANPTDGHPVFGSRMKRRLREGAKLIVADPRKIDLVKSPHIKADYHLPLKPGSNVAFINSLAHVIVTEGLVDEAYVRERCDLAEFESWARFIAEERHSPENQQQFTGLDPAEVRAAARLYATGGAAGDLLRAGRHRAQPGLDHGHGHGQHRHGHRQHRQARGRREPAARPEQRPGLLRHGLVPARAHRLPPRLGRCHPRELRGPLGRQARRRAGPAHHQHARRGRRGRLQGHVHPGRGHRPVRPRHAPRHLGPDGDGVHRHPGPVPERDRQVRPRLPAGRLVPGEGRDLHQRRAPHLAGSARSWRRSAATATGKARCCSPTRWATRWSYSHPSEIMDEIASLTPSFTGVSYAKLDELGSVQWPCNEKAPLGTPMMHVDRFVRGKGRFMITEFVATEERTGAKFPLILTTGRILSQYNVGAQTRRTENSRWHEEDVLEIHPFDAELRGIVDGDLVSLESRSGDIALKARISERMQPGVVYTTFHHAKTGANVITTDYSDWATNCPEYKVTAVQVRRTNRPSDWQAKFYEEDFSLTRIANSQDTALDAAE